MMKVRTRMAVYGPYVQSERQAQGIYMKYAKKLIEKGEAYYCFCDKERLRDSAVRLLQVKRLLFTISIACI